MPSPRQQTEKAIKSAIRKFPEVKLAYLFGSRATGTAGALSDYDIAVYTDGPDKKERFELKLNLIGALSRALKSDSIDCVILNDAQGPELKYNIIKSGRLLYVKEPFKVLVEPAILNEYFDFRQSLLKYNLTSA